MESTPGAGSLFLMTFQIDEQEEQSQQSEYNSDSSHDDQEMDEPKLLRLNNFKLVIYEYND